MASYIYILKLLIRHIRILSKDRFIKDGPVNQNDNAENESEVLNLANSEDVLH